MILTTGDQKILLFIESIKTFGISKRFKYSNTFK